MNKIKLHRISEVEINELSCIKDKLINVPQTEARINYARISELLDTRDFRLHKDLYVELLFTLGEFNGRTENIPTAQDIFQRIAMYCKRYKLSNHELRAKANFAITKAQCGYYHEAIDVWNSILEQDCPLKTRLNLLNNISVGYGILGEYNKAIDYAFLTIELVEANNLPEHKISPLINLGSAYGKLGDNEKALSTWMEAYNLAIQHGQIRRACECCNNLSLAFIALDKPDEAMDYANKCLLMGNDVYIEHEFANPYNNIGFINETIGNLEEALKYYLMALDIFTKGVDKLSLANCMVNIASVFLKKKDYDAVIEYLSKADALDLAHSVPQIINRGYALFAETYAERGDYELAYMYQKRLIDSLNKNIDEVSQNSISKKEAEYYLKKIENQGEQYRRQNEELKKKNRVIKKKTRELTKSNRNLTDSLELLNRVISVISHDLRAPLSNVAKVTEYILDGTFKGKDANECITDIHNSSMRMFELTDELLDGIRLQNRSIDADTFVDSQNVIPILNSIVSIYKPIAKHKFIKLDFKAAKTEMYARVDIDLLKIVIRNLLNNAVKFTSEKGKITLNASYDHNQISLIIEDNGIGMNSTELKRIMKGRPLQRISNNSDHGMGLGLNLCKDALKKMNAKMSIESAPAKGTKVTILLPPGEVLN